jgi:uncharacterized protein YjbJ (UPF0337 family)
MTACATNGSTGWKLIGRNLCAPDRPSIAKEQTMNRQQLEGNWKQVAGKIKEQWGKLTDDDLTKIAGKQEQLEGMLEERYGWNKEQIKKQVEDFMTRH